MTKQHIFKNDNAIGKRGEAIFKAFLDRRNAIYTDVSEDGEYQEQDIDFVVDSKRVPGKKIYIEVKNDTRIASTGNIFFETMSNVDYSTEGCFSKTKANYIAIVSESERLIYFVKTQFLKKFIEEHSHELRFIPRVPGSNSCGYLIPLKKLGENVASRSY